MWYTQAQVAALVPKSLQDTWLARRYVTLRQPGLPRRRDLRRLFAYDEICWITAVKHLADLGVPLQDAGREAETIGHHQSGYLTLWRRRDDFEGPLRSRVFPSSEALVGHLDRLDVEGVALVNVEALHARCCAALGLEVPPETVPPPAEAPVVNPPLQAGAIYRKRAEALMDAERERREIRERGEAAARAAAGLPDPGEDR